VWAGVNSLRIWIRCGVLRTSGSITGELSDCHLLENIRALWSWFILSRTSWEQTWRFRFLLQSRNTSGTGGGTGHNAPDCAVSLMVARYEAKLACVYRFQSDFTVSSFTRWTDMGTQIWVRAYSEILFLKAQKRKKKLKTGKKGKAIPVTGHGAHRAPTLSRQSAHRWRWGCQPYAPAVLYPLGSCGQGSSPVR
jgi:hypothetical protein